jgi:hypothetical protein
MLLIVIAVLAGVICSMTGFVARRHAVRLEREIADDAAIRDLYDHYRTGIDALTQAYLPDGPSDEEWLDGIRARASAPGGAQQTEPFQVRRSIPDRTLVMPPEGSFLSACLPLLGVVVAGAIIAGGLMLAPSVAVLVLLVAVVGGGYFVSLRIHPLRRCPTCSMTGRHFGGIYASSYRRCRRCDGSGRVDRLGAKVFFGGTAHTGIFSRK